MIKRSIFSILSVITITFCGCQKCTECKDICYMCSKSFSPTCSSNFPSRESFDAMIAAIRATGSICKDTTSKIYEKICDDKQSLKKFIEIYEKDGYVCN